MKFKILFLISSLLGYILLIINTIFDAIISDRYFILIAVGAIFSLILTLKEDYNENKSI